MSDMRNTRHTPGAEVKACVVCGKALMLVQRKYCAKCAEDVKKEFNKTYRRKNPGKRREYAREYMRQKRAKESPRTCCCCNKPLEKYKNKYCASCGKLARKILERISKQFYRGYRRHDITIVSQINESNIARTCGVPNDIECENCPLPDCIE